MQKLNACANDCLGDRGRLAPAQRGSQSLKCREPSLAAGAGLSGDQGEGQVALSF